MRKSIFAALACACATAAAAGQTSAAPASDAGVHAIVLVDVIPTDLAAGRALLTDYVSRARQDRDVVTVTLVQQDSIPNHFMLEESFRDHAAHDRFVAEDRVRAFRAALFPHLGSPWDERLGATLTH